MSIIEALAVALGLAYLVLAIREQRSCWIAGGLASLLFLYLLWDVQLPMQALLQVYYVVLAIHGWRHWGGQRGGGITRRGLSFHLSAAALLLGFSAVTLYLRQAEPGVREVLDTLTTWGGVLATWMIARKICEAWLYWVVIDIATSALYLGAGLGASSALYVLYTVLAFLGWKEWQRSLQTAPER